MFRTKSEFKTPVANAKVWRYMDLAKFLSILDRKALFFPTITTLRKEDRWEGSWMNFEASQYVGGDEKSKQESQTFINSKMSEAACKQLAISCWHENDYESTAMWKLYLMGDEGIAIQTTFDNLENSFLFNHRSWPKCGGNFKDRNVELIAGQMEYIDWSNPPRNTDILRVAMLKGKSLEYEKELRIIARLFPIPGILHSMDKHMRPIDDASLGLSWNVLKQIKKYGGVFIPIDVKALITNIYVVPTAAPWFIELVDKLAKKYRLNAAIHCSNTKPTY